MMRRFVRFPRPAGAHEMFWDCVPGAALRLPPANFRKPSGFREEMARDYGGLDPPAEYSPAVEILCQAYRVTSWAKNFPKTEAALREGIAQRLHLGAQIYISQHAHVLAHDAIGEVNPGEPLRTDHVMLWLSAGKPITAVAIAMLVENGKLDIDAFVSRYLPEFAQGGKEKVTVRHLLTHTGGFRGADLLPTTRSWPEMIAEICRSPIERSWVPGEKAGYQLHASWFVLAEVVRRLDGRDFSKYVREKIFEPLAMKDSWIGMPAEQFRKYGSRLAPIYNTSDGMFKLHAAWNRPENWIEPRPGSNACGPMANLGKFYESLLGFHPLLTPTTVKLFTQRQRVGMFDETFQHRVDLGLGFIINSNRYGVETVPYGYGRYASEKTFGHSGSQSSSAFADPEHGLAVAWACNGMPGELRHQKRARAINAAIYEDLGLPGATESAAEIKT